MARMSEKAKLYRKRLKAAKKVIVDPKNWTRNTYAKDKQGHGASVIGDDAISFCAIGALRRAFDDQPSPEYDECRALMEACVPDKFIGSAGRSVTKFNDNRWTKHPDVLAMFDCAIDKAAKV